MGILSGIGKIIFFPILYPARKAKEKAEREWNERPKIRAVVQTDYPETFRYVYEEQGHKTDIMAGKVVVWEDWMTDNDIEAVKKKLSETV